MVKVSSLAELNNGWPRALVGRLEADADDVLMALSGIT
jgi:hypothetical protein